ncbi:hypothetical protein AB0G04_42665 [Actinoplanes sp. NPDC023801]|uniref:hypothetical protein n=1 Tax=Actinoplanes sp. NPDC023801 TaxID=3154595 RepID=UPI0033D745EB
MPGSLGHVVISVLDERVRETIDVARPYWQRLSDATSWSEATNRRLDEHDHGRGRYLPAPAEPARAMAGLLATRWGAADFGWLHDHVPGGLPHLTERLGGPLGRVPLRPQWEGADVATLHAEGWSAERIRRDALTPAEAPADERLAAMVTRGRLPTLVRLWQSTGLPDDVAPRCAAAGLSPDEAVDRHRDGTLAEVREA